MRYISFLFIILILAPTAFSAETITITKLSGKVEIKEPGGGWSKAFEGREIPAGTLISTGFKSEAVIDMGGSSDIYVRQLTRMSVDELKISGNMVDTKLNLRLGRITADVKTSEGLKHNFTLRTPVSTAAVRGTKFNSSVRKLEVVSGKIKYSNNAGQSTTIGGGSSSSITGNGYSSTPQTSFENTTAAFEVETSTQPDPVVPSIIVPPAPTTGTVTITWDIEAFVG